MAIYSAETDPNIIIHRYRRRADEYRRMAEREPSIERYLIMAEFYDGLAEGMRSVIRSRGWQARAAEEEISN